MSATTSELITLSTDIGSVLIGMGLLCVAIMGLKQISEVKLTRINQANRDSYEYSDKIVDYFLEKIYKKNNELNFLGAKFGIKQTVLKEFTHPKQIFDDAYNVKEFNEFKNLFEKTKQINGNISYIDTKMELSNQIEKICFMISTDLPHKNMVYDCIGNALLVVICHNKDILRFIRGSSSKRAGAGKFIFTQKVYTDWYHKNSSEKSHAQITSLEQQIFSLKQEIQNDSLSSSKFTSDDSEATEKPAGTY